MIDDLEPIALRDLKALGAPRSWEVDTSLDQLPSLTPVRGSLSAEHRGNVLAVEGQLQTIVTLTCDRCLGQFNRKLSCQPSELIWLGETPPSDLQLRESDQISEPDGLVECLDPRGAFEPRQWAFEQLSLQLPVVNRCGEDCPGPSIPSHPADDSDANHSDLDPRWQALRELQRE